MDRHEPVSELLGHLGMISLTNNDSRVWENREVVIIYPFARAKEPTASFGPWGSRYNLPRNMDKQQNNGDINNHGMPRRNGHRTDLSIFDIGPTFGT